MPSIKTSFVKSQIVIVSYGQQSKEAERPQKMPIHSQPQGIQTQFTIQKMQIEEIMRERQSLQEAIQRQRRALKHV
jgi:hypothetical protein